MSAKFEELIAAIPNAVLVRPAPDAIADVIYDSRQARPGSCFVCRRGLRSDGHTYIEEALQRGSTAVVVERSVHVPDGVGLAIVKDGRKALAALARRFWGDPDRRLGLVGVTGTDGKTPTARLISWMLSAYNVGVGESTTVNARVGGQYRSTKGRLTTPEAPVTAELLYRMVEAGDTWAVIEAASHALELGRVDGFAFNRAVITNVTHEHLDLHGSLAAYRRAKRSLLDLLEHTPDDMYGRAAVLNADDPVVARFASGLTSEVLTFGEASNADVRVQISDSNDGEGFVVAGSSPWGNWEGPTTLRGRWNGMNVAAAVACVGSIVGEISSGVDRLSEFPPVPGRLQFVDVGQPFQVVIDFAHTPAALTACLTELRQRTLGQLLVVFGSAGDQDTQKRPMLGQAVSTLADLAIVTSEDPRSECQANIAQSILDGVLDNGSVFETIHERRAAIARAFELAKPGDVVLLAGKGHERSIAHATYEESWDEFQVSVELLGTLGYTNPG